MSAFILDITNQIENVQVENVENFIDKIVFHALFTPKKTSCPCCGCAEAWHKGKKNRKLRIAPLGNKMAWLILGIHRLQCTTCQHVWWSPIPFVRGKRRVTVSFEQYVIKLMEFATVEHVATFLGCSWDLIKNIHKAHLQREFQSPNLLMVQYIGVDEFSLRKGHKYMTIFINLETGAILHAVEGKSIDSVMPFMLQLKGEGVQLKAIAMDMNATYASAVGRFLPNVDIVFDRFQANGIAFCLLISTNQ